MEAKPIILLFNDLVLAEISKDYDTILITLTELSKAEFTLKSFELELIDSCLKNSITKKRQTLNKLNFLLSSLEYSKSNPNTKVLNVEESKIKDLGQSTRELIKLTANRGEESNCILNLNHGLDEKTQRSILNRIKEDLMKLLLSLYSQVILISNNFLSHLENKDQEEIKLYFLKTIADYSRYTWEITKSKFDKTETEQAYKEAKKAANQLKTLNKYNLLYHKFFLNYSVFLYDMMEDKEKAIEEAKQFLETTLLDYDEIKTNEHKDVILICQIVKDNMSLWMQSNPNEFTKWLEDTEKKELDIDLENLD